jgi:hypothetical protein
MTTIEIMQADGAGARFTVVVTDEDGSATTHEVTVLVDDWARFGAGFSTTRELVEASFAFLLEREPKESILRTFELSVIARYFPDYPAAIAEHP